MSAGIEINDSGFCVGERPWHNLPQMKVLKEEECPTVYNALEIAGLNWNVKQERVLTESGNVIPNLYANVREDTNGVLGTVTSKYKIVQNVESLDFVDNLLDGTIHFESAGSLFGGKQIWLLARMEDREVFGDKYENYLCFSNDHSGKGSVKAVITPIRVVCNNTLQCALNTNRTWSIRHLGNIQAKKQEAIKTLGLATSYLSDFELKAENLYKYRGNWDKFLDALIPIEEEKSERIKNNTLYVRDCITNLYNNKDDLQNFKGTGWGMYNAVADYVSNSNPLRNAPTFKERKFDKLMLGEHDLLKKAELLLVA